MALIKTEAQEGIFASVLADGKIHIKASEDTEGAVLRKYKTSSGEEGEKWELLYDKLVGFITRVQFEDGIYGEQMKVTIHDEDTEDQDDIILCLPTSGNFANDLMKKLPSINLKKMVMLSPYSFESDKGKNQRGITVLQDGDEKIISFFKDKDGKDTLHGFPKIPTPKKGTKITTKEWKKYFEEVSEFLVEYNTELFKSEADNEFEEYGK